MAKLLYAIKIDLLGSQISSQLPQCTVFAAGQLGLGKIKRFVHFSIFCYLPWWLTATSSSSAPKSDLLLINAFILYANTDTVISKAAEKSFNRHLWYVTEELAPLALYSNDVDNNTKQKMENKILHANRRSLCSKRNGSGFGKPAFCKMPSTASSDLSVFL